MSKEIITSTKGDEKGSISELIDFLQESVKAGATDYQMEWSEDPRWAFKWFKTYRIKSDEEIAREKIAHHKAMIKLLEDGLTNSNTK